jgi:hypothetical protein
MPSMHPMVFKINVTSPLRCASVLILYNFTENQLCSHTTTSPVMGHTHKAAGETNFVAVRRLSLEIEQGPLFWGDLLRVTARIV